MEFDKSKVYTALNADEVKSGSIGFVANTLADLENKLKETDSYCTVEISDINCKATVNRFVINNDGDMSFPLFYLLEEPEEKKFRPYNDTDEMLVDYKFKYQTVWADFTMPEIWLKNTIDVKRMISGFYKRGVVINNEKVDMNDLFKYYTYLDGSPCGMEVKK